MRQTTPVFGLLALLAVACAPIAPSIVRQAPQKRVFTAEHAGRFAQLALTCVHREYPNKISHVMQSDGDVQPPRALTPAFYGCFDWHSSVHGHWLLARLARQFPNAKFADDARAALDRSLTVANITDEIAHFNVKGRASWERPYGLAWLLQLDAELRDWDDLVAVQWAAILAPLAMAVRDRLVAWLPKLSHPIRTGEHSQTAFAMGLMLDWARTVEDREFEELIVARAKAFYVGDRNWNFAFEPSGQDFLSPGLAEADLMRRVLTETEFGDWLGGFLPGITEQFALTPAVVTDKSDGKLAHLDGLNLARAWMLEGIAQGLGSYDVRRPAVLAVAAAHRTVGLAAVTGEHYEGGHWLGSFAVYLVTERGY